MLSNEDLHTLEGNLGIVDYKLQQDFSLYYKAAVQKYKEMSTSYVKRNLPFLMSSLQTTLTHATNPAKNPSGFGLALGTFTGIMEKCVDAAMFKAMLESAQTFEILTKILQLFRKVPGLDMMIIGTLIATANPTELTEHERAKMAEMIMSLS